MFRKSNYVTALGSLFVLLMLAGAAFAIEAPSAEFLHAALVDQLQGASIEVSYDYGFDGKPETVTRFRYEDTADSVSIRYYGRSTSIRLV